VLFGNGFSSAQFSYFKPFRFAQRNFFIDKKHGLPSSFTNVNMDRLMLVTIKEELTAVLFENSGPSGILCEEGHSYKPTG